MPASVQSLPFVCPHISLCFFCFFTIFFYLEHVENSTRKSSDRQEYQEKAFRVKHQEESGALIKLDEDAFVKMLGEEYWVDT